MSRFADIYRSFETLPSDHRRRQLAWLGDHIRGLQGEFPKTAAALQPLYDAFYMRVGQDQADAVFVEADAL